jgi:hypothetical protein
MKSNTKSFALALLASASAAAASAQELGRVHFETSCTPQAQEKFDRGLAMVHSFAYPDSVQAFSDAAAVDPQCRYLELSWLCLPPVRAARCGHAAFRAGVDP